MIIIAPAGSNITYIGFILNNIKIKDILTYHNLYFKQSRIKTKFSWIHNLDINYVSKQDVKIYFDHYQEVIILNWHIKFRTYPNSKHDTDYGKSWEQEQKLSWEKFTTQWEERAILHQTIKILTETNISQKIYYPGRNFNGSCLYKGYAESKEEFLKFGINYSKSQYDVWKDSQKPIFDRWHFILSNITLEKIKKIDSPIEKGIALGVYSINNKIVENELWEKYIKY